MLTDFMSSDYDHALDPKGRVTLPAYYRDYFRDGAVLVRFPDKENSDCISVYHPDAWKEYDRKHLEPLDVFGSEDDDWTRREIYMNQRFVEPDAQGRVLLPAHQIRELGLSGKVKIIGNRDCLEIWDPETLEGARKKRAEKKAADKQRKLAEQQRGQANNA
jgi:MraZ protein